MRAMKNRTMAVALLGLLAGLPPAPAGAAEASKKEGSAFGKGSGPLLTREQLRSCMTRKTRLAQQDDELMKEKAALGAVSVDLVTRGDALKARLETLDRGDPDAVAAYNEQAQARDAQIDAYQARVEAFNTRAGADRGERDAYAKACQNRRYLEDDEIAIRKSR